MAKLSATDWMFLRVEKPNSPTHVAVLQIYELPEGYKGNFICDLLDEYGHDVSSPFNLVLEESLIPGQLPRWIVDEDFDFDNHVRHSALPGPGSMEQLEKLVARLHARLLDRLRPLWEIYFIEGLEGNRIAVYIKIHHALIDGIGGMAMLESTLTKSPTQRMRHAIWHPDRDPRRRRSRRGPKGPLQQLLGFYGNMFSLATELPDLGVAVAKMGIAGMMPGKKHAAVPFRAPKTVLNVPISSSRRFATKTIPLGQVKLMGKGVGGTVNDIVLAICAGALRRYLAEHGELPKAPLIGTVAVSIRQKADGISGNQLTALLCNLATDVEDPIERLKIIMESVADGKSDLAKRTNATAKNIALLLGVVTIVMQELKLTEPLPPPYNLIISNVRGASHPLYMNGARLVANYPMSLLADGQALNMTVQSHEDAMDFGLLGCRDALPDLDRLADCLEDAYLELKQAIGLATAARATIEPEAEAEAESEAEPKIRCAPDQAFPPTETPAKPAPTNGQAGAHAGGQELRRRTV